MQDKRIVFTRPDGGVSIIVPAEGCTEDQALSAVPDGFDYRIIDATSPAFADRTFRDAWCACKVNGVKVDLQKAKTICHKQRRANRAAEFAPLDVEATVPVMAEAAESKRQIIRDKYALMQTEIDRAKDSETLKSIMTSRAT